MHIGCPSIFNYPLQKQEFRNGDQRIHCPNKIGEHDAGPAKGSHLKVLESAVDSVPINSQSPVH
jgi:hypothetical protein